MANKKGNLDPTSAQAENPAFEFDELDELEQEIESTGEESRDLSARVYRMIQAGNGQTINEYCHTFYEKVNEQMIGDNFGAGKYVVLYTYKDREGKRKQTSRRVNIAREFGSPRIPNTTEEKTAAQAAQTQTNAVPTLAGFLGGMDAAKIAASVTAIVAAVKGIKEILTPPAPPPQKEIDFIKLIEVLNAARGNSAPSIGDAVIMKALDMQKPAAPQKTIVEQLTELKQAKEIIKDSIDETDENGGDDMKSIIKIGLQMLPGLLAAHGGNYQQAGAAAKNIPAVTDLLKNDSEIATEFINAVAAKYGDNAAEQLADGFGYEWTKTPAEAPQIANEDNGNGAPESAQKAV